MNETADTRAQALLAPLGVTPEHTRGAALTLADHAEDADELREWLAMCGLTGRGRTA